MDAEDEDDPITMSTIIPFLDLAKMLEKVSTARKRDKTKTDAIKKFFERFRKKFEEMHHSLDPADADGDSIFSIVRLLCPKWDRERSSYGIKDVKLGQIFAKVYGIDKTSSDGKKLYNYKNPDIVGSIAGDMGAVISAVLDRRSSSNDRKDGPTIHDLHQVLDQLAKNKDAEDKVTQGKQIENLQRFVQRLGPLEGKWLAKIILKKMDLGINESSILDLMHPQAKELLNTMSLLDVCQFCNDPRAQEVPTGKVTLFAYFKPMLCHRLDLENEGDGDSEIPRKVIVGKWKKNPIVLPPAPFLVETKFDGERFQIHYQRGPAGGEPTFKYISRGGYEYKEFKATLTPRLKGQILQNPPVESFIIDGEMMAYNIKNKNFTPKGQNMDVKTLRPDDQFHKPAYVAWDLLYLNGDSVCDKPLVTRLELLKKVIQPLESVCYISESKECDTLENVLKLLDEHIERCEEGIVIKNRNSIYEPGQRKTTWLKLKPEYVVGYRVDDLDLLIIGGFYADKKNRGGTITSLLLGVLDGKDVYPVTKVGCGRLKHSEMASLVKSLEPYFVTREVPGVKFKGKRPDVLIHPNKSTVLQVNASEITRTTDYALNYCLRFPVVVKVRKDKAWNEAMTVSEFHDLRLSCKQGKLLRKRGSDGTVAIPGPSSKYKKDYFGQRIKFEQDSGDEAPPTHGPKPSSSKAAGGKAKPKPVAYVSPTKIQTTTDAAIAESNRVLKAVEQESNLFQGKVFHVMGTSSSWKTETELKLTKQGAEIVKNPTTDTFAIVADKVTEAVKRKMATGKWEILNGTSWIEKCIMGKAIRDWVPQDLFYSTEATQEAFAKDFDIYGDSYTELLTTSESKDLVERVIKNGQESDKDDKNEDFDQTKRRLYKMLCGHDKKLKEWSFFRKCKVAFYPTVDPGFKAFVEFYGGKVVPDWKSSQVTHIIKLDGHDATDDLKSSSIPVLGQGWIESCVKDKELVSKKPFRLRF